MSHKKFTVNRRRFIQMSAATAAGITLLPACTFGAGNYPLPMKRRFGRLNFDVTTLGLGGQASIQWTPEDVDPVKIILKAFETGVNYFDTSNLYQESQSHYGAAFKELHLVPGEEIYDEGLRKSIFLTTKSHIRWGKAPFPEVAGVGNWTQGDHGEGVIGDVKRSLTQMFGDGEGAYPEGAYVDMVLCHSLNNTAEIDVLYKGLETPLNPDENFGALVALRDYRDGTNFTGLNPDNEKLLRHIGFSGHNYAPAMIDMIQRDEYGILDGMLIAINPNDRLHLNMQYNVIPVAEKKGLGIIAMKVFADGAMYTKDSKWSSEPADVVRTVGSEALPSQPLIEYALTIPGIHTAIIGIGHVDDDPLKCQLVQNYYAAQIKPDALTEEDRRRIEETTRHIKDGKTNWFQTDKADLSAPGNVRIEDGVIAWDTAIAGDEPILKYEIIADNVMIAEVEHAPQTSKKPFTYEGIKSGGTYFVKAVDRIGREAKSETVVG